MLLTLRSPYSLPLHLSCTFQKHVLEGSFNSRLFFDEHVAACLLLLIFPDKLNAPDGFNRFQIITNEDPAILDVLQDDIN